MAWFHRLREPQRGDRITADWARELVKAVRSMRLFAGPGIRLTETPDGTTVSLAGSGAGGPRPKDGRDGEDGGEPGPSGDEARKLLGGSGYEASQDDWEYGETSAAGKPLYPKFNPTRLYFRAATHQLLMFRRTLTFNAAGMLVAVSAETAETVFSAVEESH